VSYHIIVHKNIIYTLFLLCPFPPKSIFEHLLLIFEGNKFVYEERERERERRMEARIIYLHIQREKHMN
jgi:hypothetical protein